MKRKFIVTLGIIILLLTTFTAISFGGQETNALALDYQSPRPGATHIPPESTIGFRLTNLPHGESLESLLESMSVTAVASKSGNHSGELILSGDTFIFKPNTLFQENDHVAVTIGIDGGERPISFQYDFYTSPKKLEVDERLLWPDLFPEEFSEAVEQVPTQFNPLPNYRTTPQDFPILNIYTAPGTEDGYIFLSHFHYSNVSNGKAYLMMFDNDGEPVYYKRLHPYKAALDFKKQPNGLLTYANAGTKTFEVMDQSYQNIGSYKAGNGYLTDLHDFQMLPNNNVLILALDYRLIDMSVIVPGGNPSAVVGGCVVQELDSQGNVVFEWRSWDHIPITDSNVDLTLDRFNYIHCNSVELDFDGHLLISSRHLDEVTKINRQTGDIIWRLGGKGNQFIFSNDAGFFYQHDARRLPDGRLSLYDNRSYMDPTYSRGVEYILDEVNLIATRVYEYRNTPDAYGGSMGNYQRLPGGNTIVGWGWSDSPVLTEALPDGTKVFELSAQDRFGTYRAFKFDWVGFPTWSPQLIGYSDDRTVNLFFSYNGATEIVGYRIYGDTNNPPNTLLAGVLKDGFENSFTFDVPSDELYYFRVMPILADGSETQFSNTLPVFVNALSVYLPLVNSPN